VIIAVGVANAQRAASERSTVPPRRTVRTEALGCYVLLNDDLHPIGGSYQYSSAHVRLDSTSDSRPGVVPGEFRRLLTFSGSWQPTYPAQVRIPPMWSADSLTDSVRFAFSNGFVGTAFTFAVPAEAADTLRGRAWDFWDFGPPFGKDHGRAYAVRIDCPMSASPSRTQHSQRAP
jgi:hypothetical protein